VTKNAPRGPTVPRASTASRRRSHNDRPWAATSAARVPSTAPTSGAATTCSRLRAGELGVRNAAFRPKPAPIRVKLIEGVSRSSRRFAASLSSNRPCSNDVRRRPCGSVSRSHPAAAVSRRRFRHPVPPRQRLPTPDLIQPIGFRPHGHPQFDVRLRRGLLPPAPPELRDRARRD